MSERCKRVFLTVIKKSFVIIRGRFTVEEKRKDVYFSIKSVLRTGVPVRIFP